MDYLNTAKEGHADIQDDVDDKNSVMRTIMTSLTIMTTKTQITMPKKKTNTYVKVMMMEIKVTLALY